MAAISKDALEARVAFANVLVRKAFGNRFSGDWWHSQGIDGGWERNSPAGLDVIGRRIGTFPFSLLNFVFGGDEVELVGGFVRKDGSSSDGSVIYVKPQFRSQAERYASLYHEATGRPVEIQVGLTEENLETYVLPKQAGA